MKLFYIKFFGAAFLVGVVLGLLFHFDMTFFFWCFIALVILSGVGFVLRKEIRQALKAK
jgi:uncharacterized iron-regulated membrane protein